MLPSSPLGRSLGISPAPIVFGLSIDAERRCITFEDPYLPESIPKLWIKHLTAWEIPRLTCS